MPGYDLRNVLKQFPWVESQDLHLPTLPFLAPSPNSDSPPTLRLCSRAHRRYHRSSRYRRLHSSSARRLRSGERTAVAADLSPNAQKSLPSQFRRRTQLRRRHLTIAAELVTADFAEEEFAAITGKNSSPPQQRAIAVEAESYLPSPSQQGAVLPSRRHHHRSRLFRLPLPLQQQRAPGSAH
nr:hypothetical protein Iba_chr02eCG5380 [Ipomoea batatas]